MYEVKWMAYLRYDNTKITIFRHEMPLISDFLHDFNLDLQIKTYMLIPKTGLYDIALNN